MEYLMFISVTLLSSSLVSTCHTYLRSCWIVSAQVKVLVVPDCTSVVFPCLKLCDCRQWQPFSRTVDSCLMTKFHDDLIRLYETDEEAVSW